MLKNVLLSASILMSISTNCTAEKPTRSEFFKNFLKKYSAMLEFTGAFCVGGAMAAAESYTEKTSTPGRILMASELLTAGVLLANGMPRVEITRDTETRIKVSSNLLPLLGFVSGLFVFSRPKA